MPSTPFSLDILAIAAHRDDIEQTCGGTMLKMSRRGHRTGILDLTRGEMGTRGTAVERAQEAADAAKILGVCWRRALDIPDGRVENTWENRLKVAAVIREVRPRVVILPFWDGRHPDHYTCSTLGYEACFLAGLAKLELHPASPEAVENSVLPKEGKGIPGPLPPHRPYKIIYATLYYDIRPTFVVDIGDEFEGKLASIMAYKSQFSDQEAGKEIFPAHAEIRTRVDAMGRHYGMLAGITHAEPFLQKEIGLIDDLMAIPVKSI